jgi:hypothetical protein
MQSIYFFYSQPFLLHSHVYVLSMGKSLIFVLTSNNDTLWNVGNALNNFERLLNFLLLIFLIQEKVKLGKNLFESLLALHPISGCSFTIYVEFSPICSSEWAINSFTYYKCRKMSEILVVDIAYGTKLRKCWSSCKFFFLWGYILNIISTKKFFVAFSV